VCIGISIFDHAAANYGWTSSGRGRFKPKRIPLGDLGEWQLFDRKA
jgi:hypothetical protein